MTVIDKIKTDVELTARFSISKMAQDTKKFKGAQAYYTEQTLVLLTLDKVIKDSGDITKKKIVVFFNEEWVTALVTNYGVNPVNITFVTDDSDRAAIMKKMLRSAVTIIDINIVDITTLGKIGKKMKQFDIGLGNPPFSMTNPGKEAGKRSMDIYPEFYKLAVKHCGIVAMVMPNTKTRVNMEHNKFLKSTAYDVVDVTKSQMKEMGVIIKMWTVFHDKNKTANVEANFANLTLASNKSRTFNKGKLNVSGEGIILGDKSRTNKTPVYHAIHQSGPVLTYTNSIVPATKCLPTSGFAILTSMRINDNSWNVFVVPCNGEAVNVNVYYVLAKNETEANNLKDKLLSDSFLSAAKSLRGNSNSITLSALNSLSI